MLKILFAYLIVINVITFLVYRSDKKKAKRHEWRTPEAKLLGLAVLGGTVGAWIAMKRFRHKTQHKKFKYGIPFILLLQLMLALLIGASVYLLAYSLNPAGKENKDLFIRQNICVLYPGLCEWADSMQEHGLLLDTFICNPKGLRLHALYATHPQAKGTAVLVHGYTDTAWSMMMLGRFYHEKMHFNIILPEHERHGQSQGTAIQMGWLDRINIEQWIDLADQTWRGAPIFLHGISMGAATVMMCSGDELPVSVKGIIEDCGYTSVWDEFSGEIKNQFGLPVHPLLDLSSWLCQLRYGWNFREASALEQVSQSKLPMLFIHGENDTFVPTDMVYRLYEAKNSGYKQLWTAPETAHAMSYHNHTEEYEKQVMAFIEKATQ